MVAQNWQTEQWCSILQFILGEITNHNKAPIIVMSVW